MTSNRFILGFISLVSFGCTDKSSDHDFCDTASASGYKSITRDGVTREYLLDVPESYDSTGSALPLVLNFHGSGGCPDEYREAESDFRTLANTNNFLLAYPQGVLDSEGFPEWRPVTDGGTSIQDNDFIFVDEIIADISSEYNVDPEAIYAIGLSNGGMMAYGLACRRGNLIAAAGIVSATMLTDTCDQTTYTSIIHLHGSADNIVPMEGNQDFPAVTTGIEYWKTHNNTTTSTSNELNDGSVTRDVYSGGTEGTSVVLYTIENGYHVWFDDNIDGQSPNQILWDFLSQ